MESKELFSIEAQGYSCEAVEKYITTLKAEYKKVFDYAKATEANNEKLKKICRVLKDENEALKANAEKAPAAAEAPAAEAEQAAPVSSAEALKSAEKISVLLSALNEEAEILKSKLQ